MSSASFEYSSFSHVHNHRTLTRLQDCLEMSSCSEEATKLAVFQYSYCSSPIFPSKNMPTMLILRDNSFWFGYPKTKKQMGSQPKEKISGPSQFCAL